MDENEQWIDPETEMERLRERVAELERELTLRRQWARFRLLRFFVQTYTTRPLYSSVSKLVEQLAERNVERDTVKDVLYATLKRLTRVGAITLLIALAPLTMAVLQTYYLKKQNEKFDIQNERIEQQTLLQEAERRSSLVFLFDNVLNKIDEELRINPARRELSPQLVGRIVALTKALKPYRYLEGDTITSKMTSPERGQVLLSLLASKLNPNTYDQIFLLADFSYATLANVNLDGAYLRNINLAHAVLESVSLTGADLKNANFEEAELTDAHVQLTGPGARPAHFDFANFHKAHLVDSDFGGSYLDFANFAGAWLHNVTFQRAFLNQTKFDQVRADTLDFSEATFFKTGFSQIAAGAPDAPLVIKLTGVQLDTATFAQISRLPLPGRPALDTAQRELRINRDTFYVEGKAKPIVVVDSIELFGLKK